MIPKRSREESLGCLFAVIGVLGGCVAGGRSFARYADSVRAANPDAEICGMPAIPAMFGGMLLGGIAGAILGRVLHHIFPPEPKP